jgi:3-hydroxybutyryl-CoA dehydrogenase
MELVEIVPALQTSQEIVAKSIAMIDSWNKKTVRTKDTPGFIVNRIARPFYSEAIRLYEEGVASIETIDHAMKVYGGFRMGPFELMDLIGHDVNYAVTETVWASFYFDPRYTPSFTQKRLVEAKWFGRKSGRGFYDYAETAIKYEPELHEESAKEICWRVLVMLINEAANALFLHVASKEDIDLAMTKGVNYPKGLLHWADEKGIAACVEMLDALYEEYHEDRYRCSPLLRKMKASNTNFY